MKPASDRRFAHDVAKQLDRRRTKRRLGVWAVLIAAIALAVSYLTCGQGFGLGGKGKGAGAGAGSGSAITPLIDAGPKRCAIRVTGAGITVDGTTATRDEAVAACRGTTGADVVVTGNARQGTWDDLRGALDAAGIEMFTREPKGVAPLGTSDAGVR